jgi:hypothetical protein
VVVSSNVTLKNYYTIIFIDTFPTIDEEDGIDEEVDGYFVFLEDDDLE